LIKRIINLTLKQFIIGDRQEYKLLIKLKRLHKANYKHTTSLLCILLTTLCCLPVKLYLLM